LKLVYQAMKRRLGGVLGIEFAVDLSGRRNRSLQSATCETQKDIPMLGTIILVILVLLLISALPTWPHSSSWGYAPSGILGTILIMLILYILGRL
jgi:hypothetical protein